MSDTSDFDGLADPSLAERSAEHDADTERIHERADLLPEELAAGSDDPETQAEAILAESDRRTDQPEETRDESSQTL